MRSDRLRLCTADEYRGQPYYRSTDDMQRRLFIRTVHEKMYADEGGLLRIAVFVGLGLLGFAIALVLHSHGVWIAGICVTIAADSSVRRLRFNYVALEMVHDYQTRLAHRNEACAGG